MITTTMLWFFYHLIPTTWSDFLEPDGLSRSALAAPNLSSMLLKDLRVKTLVNLTSGTILNNKSKLRRNIFPLSIITHSWNIFEHCIFNLKLFGDLCTWVFDLRGRYPKCLIIRDWPLPISMSHFSRISLFLFYFLFMFIYVHRIFLKLGRILSKQGRMIRNLQVIQI